MRLRSVAALPLPPTPPPVPEVDLLAQIDSTARTLLRRIEGGVNMKADESAILSEQVKAFDAIVKWASVRKELLPAEKPKDNKFAGIKSAFRSASQPPRNRGGAGKAAGKDGAVSASAAAPGGDDDADEN